MDDITPLSGRDKRHARERASSEAVLKILPPHIQKILADHVPLYSDQELYELIGHEPTIKNTLDLVARAFPSGVSEEYYLPLLTLFSKYIDFDFTAGAYLGDQWAEDFGAPDNDALLVAADPSPTGSVNRVRRQLETVDSEKWLDALEENERKEIELSTKYAEEAERARATGAHSSPPERLSCTFCFVGYSRPFRAGRSFANTQSVALGYLLFAPSTLP